MQDRKHLAFPSNTLSKKKKKNSIGNGEAKELTCTTPGLKLRAGMLQGGGGAGQRGDKGKKKKWENCNRIINKIYLNTIKF